MPATQNNLAELPTPDHLTLLFKHGKSTTLLSVLPTQSFSEIKELLLAALKSRNLTKLPGESTLLPEHASQIQLGILRDRKDASKGWTPLIAKGQQISSNRAGKKKVSSKTDAPDDSPAGIGLVDGSWLAYRIAAPIDEEDDDNVMLDVDHTGWNVVLPSYDDDGET